MQGPRTRMFFHPVCVVFLSDCLLWLLIVAPFDNGSACAGPPRPIFIFAVWISCLGLLNRVVLFGCFVSSPALRSPCCGRTVLDACSVLK